MDIRQLEAFTAVMTAGSITGAAKLLGRSQPVITRLIQELEAELGYALLLRNGPRVAPAPQALQLYEEAERIVSGVRRIQQTAQDLQRAAQPRLQMVSVSALALGLVPQALAQLRDTLGPCQVELRSFPPEKVVGEVLHHGTPLGLCSLPLEHHGLQLHWIGEVPCVAVLREDDALAACAVVRVAELARRSLVGLGNRHRLQWRLDRALRSQAEGEVPAAIPVVTNASMNAQVLVRAGLGPAILEPLTMGGAPLQGLVTRPLDVHVPFFFGAITPQGSTPLPWVTEVLEALRTHAQALPGCVLHPASEHARIMQSLHEP